ncbi:luciferase-like monooxygenase family protein [Mycobacterium kansasii]|uniref:Luciferase-like monooxygenase family protein n=1 Tax=Mycobacterium kansasii TaxID=1768 RepID=A0A1V3X1T6_MYCKA|nr:luciferase-like monooxygenase family protein [Mycobacterium kansasii]
MTGVPLRFGVFITPFHPTGQSPTVALEYDMERVVALDRLGYDEAWFGEHHSGGYELIACPEIFIAAAAERTKHIRLGTGVVSLPYHHPLMVADRWVLLDHLTRAGSCSARPRRAAVGRLHDGYRSDRSAPDDAGVAGGDSGAIPRRAE